MRLTRHNIADYLCNKGFINESELIKGQFSVSQRQMRNSIFHVHRTSQKGLFVKQLVNFDPMNSYLMQKDATIHYLFHHDPDFENARNSVPAYFGYDPKEQVFVTELFPGAQNLHEFYLGKKEISSDHGIAIAKIFGAYQADLSEKIKTSASLQFLNRQIPWILDLNNPQMVQADVVLKYIVSIPELRDGLEEIRTNWSGESLVHGDIKLVNFLRTEKNGEEKILLVDWEIANLGDPLWDVAGLFQSLFSNWIMALVPPNFDSVSPEGEIWTNTHYIPFLQSFWTEYSRLMKWSEAEKAESLKKVIRFSAARLLQTAKEMNQANNQQIFPHTHQLIHYAKGILLHPEQAAAQTFGLS